MTTSKSLRVMTASNAVAVWLCAAAGRWAGVAIVTHFIVRVYKIRTATGVAPVRRVEILLSVTIVTSTKFVKKRDSTNIKLVIVVKIAEIMTSCTIIGKNGGTMTIIRGPSLALPKGRERRPIIYCVLCRYLHHLVDGIDGALVIASIPAATLNRRSPARRCTARKGNGVAISRRRYAQSAIIVLHRFSNYPAAGNAYG